MAANVFFSEKIAVTKQSKAVASPFSTLIAPEQALAAAKRLASHLPPYGAEAFQEDSEDGAEQSSAGRSFDIA